MKTEVEIEKQLSDLQEEISREKFRSDYQDGYESALLWVLDKLETIFDQETDPENIEKSIQETASFGC